jgi:hypothetical protein
MPSNEKRPAGRPAVEATPDHDPATRPGRTLAEGDPRADVTAAGSGDPDRVAFLERENAELRQKLADGGVVLPDTRPVHREPSWGLSEGERIELEQTGKTASPYTGKLKVGTGEPGEKPREVDAKTFHETKAEPQNTAEHRK